MALDYIIKNKKKSKISKLITPIVHVLIKIRIFQKYNECKFDSELLDLVELSDLKNGVVK